MVNSKKILESLGNSLLPSFLNSYLRDIYCDFKFLTEPNKNILDINISLKNSASQKRVFLLATGPSIKTENLKLIQGEDCVSLSNFFLHTDIKEIKPIFHSVGFYHPPMDLNSYLNWLKSVDEKLPLSTHIVSGFSNYKIFEKNNPFPNRKIFYIYYSRKKITKKINLKKPIPYGQTSPILLLPILAYMGYKEIYLLGCDNTTLRDYKSCISNFYSPRLEKRVGATDTNCWSDIETELLNNLKCFQEYRIYGRVLKEVGVSIINLSNDSWIDCFPRSTLHAIAKT